MVLSIWFPGILPGQVAFKGQIYKKKFILPKIIYRFFVDWSFLAIFTANP